MRQSTRLVLTFLGCAILLSLVRSSEAQDTVTLKRSSRRGAKLLGTITAVNPTGITIRTSGNERQVPANEIQRISVSGEPAGLRQARSAILAGQYEQARDGLRDVSLPSSASDVLRQELAYYRALAEAELALHGGGDPERAIEKVLAFLRKDRNTFHFFDSVKLLGDLSRAAGKYDNAARYYERLTKAPWPEYALQSQVLTGDALRAQGEVDDAIKAFNAALQVPANEVSVVRQQTFALIGLAACQSAKGKTAEAISQLEDVIAKNDPEDEPLFAKAYLALGGAYQDADRVVDALLAYLHVDLLFYNQRDAHAEALFHLTQLWPKVEQPARAVDARRLLQERYVGTAWAKKAK